MREFYVFTKIFFLMNFTSSRFQMISLCNPFSLSPANGKNTVGATENSWVSKGGSYVVIISSCLYNLKNYFSAYTIYFCILLNILSVWTEINQWRKNTSLLYVAAVVRVKQIWQIFAAVPFFWPVPSLPLRFKQRIMK